MAVESGAGDLLHVVALLGAMVVAVPLFRRLGLGSVLGYLAAGLAIGPFGLGLFTDPQAILHVAELGVVMFLFIVGLEMQPTPAVGAAPADLRPRQPAGVRLRRRSSPASASLGGLRLPVAFVAGDGLRAHLDRDRHADPRGARRRRDAGRRSASSSILLLEDLAIVPLLAIVALLAPARRGADARGALARGRRSPSARSPPLVAAGIWLLNPLFRLLAKTGAREVMTAAALLVVLGAALLMQLGGLSMAMGAFLAGVLLSESTFRHQLEAEIEPFRGLLLGLFFLGVGMALDLRVIATDWRADPRAGCSPSCRSRRPPSMPWRALTGARRARRRLSRAP